MNQTTKLCSVSGTRRPVTATNHIARELSRYDKHLHDVRGLAAGTRKNCTHVVRCLLDWKFATRPIDIAKLRPDDVRKFVAAQLDARGTASHATRLASSLRSYLRYRSTCGDQVSALMAVIQVPVHWKLATLPRALTTEEAELLLASCTAVRRWPKREYAIVRCALDLGLRASEIAHLKINDIDWRAGTLILRDTKSLRQDVLPLPMETGQALADYLQHERPLTSHPSVFVRKHGTQDHPITSMAIQKLLKRACQRIGLMHASGHALRHTVACRMVENGSSLKEVADVLRHRSLDTTLIYAKLDTPKLVAVALPWPGSTS
jgi:integrase